MTSDHTRAAAPAGDGGPAADRGGGSAPADPGAAPARTRWWRRDYSPEEIEAGTRAFLDDLAGRGLVIRAEHG